MPRKYKPVPKEEQKKRGPKTDRLPSADIQQQIINRVTLGVPKKVISEHFGVSSYMIDKIILKDQRNKQNQPNQAVAPNDAPPNPEL